MDQELPFLPITILSRELASRKLSPVELVQAPHLRPDAPGDRPRRGVMASRRVTSWWRSCVLVTGLAVILSAQSQTAEAQQATKPPRIGILSAGPLPPRKHQWEAFRQGLRELGYVEGENIVIEFRAPQEEGGRHEDLAADLARLKVNVIVAATTPAIQAAKKATSTIPIVMATSNDPVEAGLVASLARPGGNVTGLSMLAVELSAKRLQLLREIVPGLSRVAVLWNPDTPVPQPCSDRRTMRLDRWESSF
jgi:ABC-type uncharacterized transport system substrate-binding protein